MDSGEINETNIQFKVLQDISSEVDPSAGTLLLSPYDKLRLDVLLASESIFDLDLKTKTIYFSPGWKKMLGYAEDELANEVSEWERLTSKDDAIKAWDMLNKNIQNKSNYYTINYRMLHKSGNWLDLLTAINITYDENGEGERVIGVHHDINEFNEHNTLLDKKNSEIEAQNRELIRINDDLADANDALMKSHFQILESEQKMRSIFAAAPIGIGVVHNRVFSNVNHFLLEMTGYSENELIGKSSRMLYPSDEEYDYVGREKYKRINEKGTGTVETKWITKDGHLLDILLSSTPVDPFNHDKGVTFSALDISYLKQADKKLKDSNKTLSDIINSLHSGLIVYQFEEPDRLVFMAINKQAVELVNPEGAVQLIGKEYEDFWKSEIDLELKQKYLEVIRTGSLFEIDNLLYSNYGVTKNFKISAYTIPGNRLGVAFEDITSVIEAQSQAFKSELKYSKLIASSFDAIYIMEGRRYTFVNPQFTALTGYSEEEILSENFEFSKLFNDESIEIIEQRFLARKRGEEVPSKYETQIVSKDGSVKDVEVSNVSIGLGDNVVVMGIMRDITAKKIAEREIILSHKTYLGILNSLVEAVYIQDENGMFLFVNTAAENLYGYDKEYFIGKTPDFVSAPGMNDLHKVSQKVQKALMGEPQNFEFWGLNSKQEAFPKSVNLTRGTFFGKQCVIATARNISLEKKSADNLKQSEEKYRNLIDKMQEGLFVVDNDFIIKFSNNYFSEMLGFSDYNQLLGQNILTSFISEKSKILVQQNKNEVLSNKPVSSEVNMNRKDGSVLELMVNTVPVLGENGEVIGSMATCLDISDIKRVERELILAKEKAEESDRLKTAFLANMSHEIRTPMNGIMGFSTLLADNNLSNEERIEYANILNSSSRRLLNTVNDILDISKIDAGQIDVNISKFNIINLFKELFNLHEAGFKHKSIELKLILSEEIISKSIMSDEQKIYQVMNNFLNNALKFTYEGRVEFGCRFSDEGLEFFVTDTGIGIAKDSIGLIFDRFTQENCSISRNYEGSGLGLAICKGLVEIIGGKISVESKQNKGSTFKFTLPVENYDELLKEEKPEQSNTSKYMKLDDCIILVAEDDNMNYILIEKILLHETNAKILHARNGIEAVELFHDTEGVCLVLMDIKMPMMDGLEASRIIRKLDPEMPIIAVTAFAMTGDKEKALAAGCTDYMSKPINSKQLMEKIQQLLNQ